MVELTSLTSRVELNEQNGPSRRQEQILRPRARISFRSGEQIPISLRGIAPAGKSTSFCSTVP